MALAAACALALAVHLGPAAARPDQHTRDVSAGAATTSTLPDGWFHGAFIEILVRAWRDSDGDGIGDLRGLTQSLDHLQELGVRGIRLLPITARAEGGPGDATTELRAIAPEYGTLADFDELIRAAHQRGIGVVMDYTAQPGAAQQPDHEGNLRFWLNRGLDGFHLEAVPPGLQDLIQAYPRRYVACGAAAAAEAAGQAGPAACSGVFAAGFVPHYVGAALGQAESVQQVATHYETAASTEATSLGPRDNMAGQRLWDQLGGDVRAYKAAAASYLLQPGTPFIQYGEEIGQAGVPGPPLRAPTPDDATNPLQAQRADPQSLFNFYKTMLKLRNGRPSLARGTQAHGFAQGLVAGWQRVHEGERTLVLINYGPQLAQAEMQNLPPNARLLSAFPEGGAQAARANARGEASLWLGPQAVRVLMVETGATKHVRKAGKAKAKPAAKARAKTKTTKKPAPKKAATPRQAKAKAAPAAR